MARLISEGKHWPADYIKTGINMVKASQLGKQSWYNDDFIAKDMQTFADEFGPLSHKNSNLGFFSTIVRWFIEFSGTSKDKYQEFIERKLDSIISTLQLVLNDPSYDKIKDEIKTKWPFKKFQELQKQVEDEKEKSSAKKMKSAKKKDDYELIPISSYEELNEKFGGPATGYKGESEWCHTNGKSTYNSWTNNGTQMFFVLAHKNWKEIKAPDPKTTNAYDIYGLSLIAILVNVATGKLLNETLRWNHIIDPSKANPGATVDKAFKDNYGELSQVVGMDVKAEVDKAIKAKQDELKNKAKYANEEVDKILKSCGDTITKQDIPDQLRLSLTEVSIPDSVTHIGNYAFYNCRSLTSISISDSVIHIGNSAFSSCESLTSISIPNSVTSIGFAAFYKCRSLPSISISNSVTNISGYTFSYCESLTSVSIPKSVTRIGHAAFGACESLTSIIIPDSVTKIGSGIFANCKSLKSVLISDSVTSIGNGTFYECRSLTSILIPKSVTSIDCDALYGCESLESVVFDGKTLDEVKEMKNYPWGIEDESIIKAEKQSKPMHKTNGRKPTKKQIKEAIAFWQNVLESLDNTNEVK